MKKFLSIFLSLIALSAFAQQNWPTNYHLTKLDNGLQVLVIEDHSVPLVTIEIAVRNGSFTEDSEYNGLSHLYEHMFFKANKDISSQEKYLDRMHDLGIISNATTNTEIVNYFATLGTKQYVDGLKFMNSAIRYPLFLQEEMKKENPVVDGEFQRLESNPFFPLINKFNHKMWGDLYSRKNPIGDHEVILTCTPEKMNVIKDKYYFPNNSLLTIAGDVTNGDALMQAKAIFGDWKASDFDAFKKWPIPPFKALNPADSLSFVVINDNARVPIMQIGWHGPDTRTDLKNTLVADVFSDIVSQKNSSFQKNLVDSGYALNAGINYFTQAYVGPITIFFVPNPGKFKLAFRALQKEIDRFDADDYFTDDQLETAKIKKANEEIYSREVTSNLVHSLSFWWSSASLDYYFSYVSEIKKITRKDIQDYVHKYIKGQPCVKGLLLNPGMQKNWNVIDLDALFK